ncbi:MAG: hypothetical protein E7658_04915 [Ruminococcaceae bacterium]|nr:hypothetical protein [Oscillospiraceae bacterium]
MTIEQILADIKSDRKKKVIFDSDTFNEIDDQYALAYCLGNPKFEVLGATAAQYHRNESSAIGVEKSYQEILRVMKNTHTTGMCPAFKGAGETVSDQPDFAPIENDASRFIVETAMASDEIIYIPVTGSITNIACAILMEPKIIDKICVLWIGCCCIEMIYQYEFNVNQDYAAGQIVFNSGVPMVLLPASGDPGHGTVMMTTTCDKVRNHYLDADTDTCRFFKENLLPAGNGEYIFWDIVAPGVLSVPEAFEFSIRPTPVLADDKKFVFDSTRHNMIYMEEINPPLIFEDCFKCMKNLK